MTERIKSIVSIWPKAIAWDEKIRGRESRMRAKEATVQAKMSHLEMRTITSVAVNYEPRDEKWVMHELYVPFGNMPMVLKIKAGAKIEKKENGCAAFFVAPAMNESKQCVVEFPASVISALDYDSQEVRGAKRFAECQGLMVCDMTDKEKVSIYTSSDKGYTGKLIADDGNICHIMVEQRQSFKKNKNKFYDDVCTKLMADMQQGLVTGQIITDILAPEEILAEQLCNLGIKKSESKNTAIFLANVVNAMDILGYDRIVGETIPDNVKKLLEEDALKKLIKGKKMEDWQLSDALPHITKFIKALHPEERDDSIALAMVISLAAAERNSSLQDSRQAYRMAMKNPQKYKAVWQEVKSVMAA